MKINKTTGICVLIILIAFSYVYAAASNPTGPETIIVNHTERYNQSFHPSKLLLADAGNLTKIKITSKTQTQTWQGYYGNITGTITLDDAQNWTMYDWAVSKPQGEIYASNQSSVTWSNIKCMNYTADLTIEGINLTTLESMFGLAPDDYDGVDETFNSSGKLSDGITSHPVVYVGTKTIAAGTCPATDTYEFQRNGNTNFVEILLTDNESIIFTTIIENDQVGNNTGIHGYDNKTHDFQMLVGENGHDGNDITSSYYFFVELE